MERQKEEIPELISVIIPVYNTEKYIDKCLTSVLGQTYKRIEVIIIDDGSTDNSKGILKKYEQFDSRVKVLRKKNSGVSAARNLGLRNATGQWIMFIDSDDYIESNMIECLYQESKKVNVDIVACEYFVDDNKKRKEKFLTDSTIRIYENEDKILLLKACIENRVYGNKKGVTNIGVPWAKMYRKSLLLDNKLLFNERLTHMEDSIFNLYAIMYSKRVLYLPYSYYHYVIRPMSAVRTSSRFEKMAELVANEYVKFSNEYNLEKKLKGALEYKFFCLYYQCIKKQCFFDGKDKRNTVKEMRRISNNYIFNGKLNRYNFRYCTKPQLLYGFLNLCGCYFGLSEALRYADKLKYVIHKE